MRADTKLKLALFFGPLVVAMLGLPLLFTTLPDPRPTPVPGLQGARSGAYVRAGGTLYRLFPFSARVAEFPSVALRTSDTPGILVKFRQPDVLSAYGLYTFPRGAPVAVAKRITPERTIELTPLAPLPPGRYYIAASRDSVYGGTDYFYLDITAGEAGHRTPSEAHTERR